MSTVNASIAFTAPIIQVIVRWIMNAGYDPFQFINRMEVEIRNASKS
jgi:hypothetical protein